MLLWRWSGFNTGQDRAPPAIRGITILAGCSMRPMCWRDVYRLSKSRTPFVVMSGRCRFRIRSFHTLVHHAVQFTQVTRYFLCALCFYIAPFGAFRSFRSPLSKP